MADMNVLIERKLRKIKNCKSISAKNKALIVKFSEYCFSTGLGSLRVLKLISHAYTIAEMLNKDFDKCTRSDIEHLIGIIERNEWKDWTKRDYKVVVKKFWKWLKGNGEVFPEEVRWLKTRIKNHRKKLPEELLSQEEIKRLIESAENARDKAMIAVLYDGGLRVGELLGLRVKNVDFKGQITKITVSGKTGMRTIPLIDSTPYLATWMGLHYAKNNPEAYLWLSNWNNGKVITYNTLRKLLVTIAKKGGIMKAINPHNFRHSRATYLANKLTEAQMKEFFGWTQGSDMAAIYVHLSGRDLDDALLAVNGLKEPEKTKEERELNPKTCSRCDKINESTAKICNRCGQQLDISTVYSTVEAQKTLDESIVGVLLKSTGIQLAIMQELRTNVHLRKLIIDFAK
ncbi:MAG: tyrosine-type recombinase/integrase [Candidatus Aenigmarchaeota archaeon]|nr:tyrosine-type recombinase/integrase [Candidatus Aenigmarchaeota archaeon]